MNRIVLYITGALFLLGILLRIGFALFFPEKFAEGARKVLFLDEQEDRLFRSGKDKLKPGKDNQAEWKE